MSDGRVRVDAAEYARRVNVAAELLAPAGSLRRPLRPWRIGSGARYGRLAATSSAPAEGGRAVVPEQTAVFTVKLPTTLAARVRERARESGSRSPPWSRAR